MNLVNGNNAWERGNVTDSEDIALLRAQIERLAGEITEDQFRPLRLQNGVYLQLHAYMLRVAIPYGTLNSAQMRALAESVVRGARGVCGGRGSVVTSPA